MRNKVIIIVNGLWYDVHGHSHFSLVKETIG